MSNRKAHSHIAGFEPPKPQPDPDKLAGWHYEDHMSPANNAFQKPITPLQGAINGPAEPEWERRDDDFIREYYGENEVQRRKWQEYNEPGGMTHKLGKR
jgi:hypothetical protein